MSKGRRREKDLKALQNRCKVLFLCINLILADCLVGCFMLGYPCLLRFRGSLRIGGLIRRSRCTHRYSRCLYADILCNFSWLNKPLAHKEISVAVCRLRSKYLCNMSSVCLAAEKN